MSTHSTACLRILQHCNCNNFSNEAAQFLAGAAVPSYFLELPNEVIKINSPVGALLLPMIQGVETSLRAGAVPQPPQLRPAPAAATATRPSSDEVTARSTDADEPEVDKTAGNGNGNGSTVPPAAPPAAAPAAAHVSAAPAAVASPDPLVEAKSRVQEIRREFAAIMATGAARAGEAAALATRRVMERHGLRPAAVAMQRG
ncbi:uncharacterized protein LOC133908056 [Phragmites australis]|uniref:uncharacterized protein LOC133908056 n=1 Tax=Phragmites australis TaxID=29695 RepID=UPI002D7904BA|nr:uncharacterized protein LOC133908056 [Phragmites australis]